MACCSVMPADGADNVRRIVSFASASASGLTLTTTVALVDPAGNFATFEKLVKSLLAVAVPPVTVTLTLVAVRDAIDFEIEIFIVFFVPLSPSQMLPPPTENVGVAPLGSLSMM